MVIPAADRDEHLGDRLALEADAVLTWLVAGYREWREHGLAEPDSVTAATDAYRAESDSLGRFLAEHCVTGAAMRVGSAELFKVWSRWCAGEGEEPGTNKSFTTAVQNKGFDTKHTNAGKVWRGIGLLTCEDGQK